MEHFVVSARKYRPQNFEEVVGQQSITNTLENAIKNSHLAQALLFTGPRGVGKTSCARILAKRINQKDSASEEDFAFNVFELDAASNNSVDDIRSLTEQVRIPPQTGNYKVYIIDEVHMLSQAAFNAFLKTLEEPPAHAIFILATTEKHKIIPTILSRCQIFDFKRIAVADIKHYLKKICKEENITAEDDALHIIAQKADGAMRDALSTFDRIISFSGNRLTREAVTQNLHVLDYDTLFEMTNLLLDNNIPQVLTYFNDILSKGFEGHHFMNSLASHFRDLLVTKDKITIELLEVSDDARKKYLEQSSKASLSFLMQAIDKANTCDLNYRASKNQRLLVELSLMQIASITFDGEKKKSTDYIIPSTFFTSLSSPKKSGHKTREVVTEKIQVRKEEKAILKEKPKPVLKNVQRRPSAFSLKSVHEKNVLKKKAAQEKEGHHSKEPFTQEKLQAFWKKYHRKLQDKGEKNTASILAIDTPVLKEGFKIQFTLPSKLMEEQLKEACPKLLKYLRKSLNNNEIHLEMLVKESLKKKFAYTPQEKYNKLKEKNPMIEKLKETFQLDL